MSILYLKKKNDDFISHCNCGESIVGDSGQLDCPWCGCGWLFSCTKCRKAFSFAEAAYINKTWEEIAQEDLKGFSGNEPSQQDIEDWVECMQHMTSHLVEGETYIYLDGCFIPAQEENFTFDGLYSNHTFIKTPQIIALEDNKIVDSVLSNPEYWRENAIQE